MARLIDRFGELREVITDKLAIPNQRIARLGTLKLELERMLVECSAGRVSDCRVLGSRLIKLDPEPDRCQFDHRQEIA